MLLLKLIYYMGISSCGIQGTEKVEHMLPRIENIFISSFLAAFGGGLIRDLFLLNVYPAAFTSACIPDIMIALISGIIYKLIQNKRYVKYFSIFADAAGLGMFISIGVDKANNMGASNIIVLFCGIITALGGGILSSIFCGCSVRKIMFSNISYRLCAFIGALLYIVLINLGIKHITSQTIIVLYTSFTAIACNQSVRLAMKTYLKYIKYSLLHLFLNHSINIQLQIMMLISIINQYRFIYRLSNIYLIKTYILFIFKCKIFTLHRIRLM